MILYQDRHVVCDDDSITILHYYFPIGAKRVAYSAIRAFHEGPLGPLTGQWRLWGMGLSPYWFHRDHGRPKKTRCIVLDLGGVVRPVVTPDDHDAVVRIIREKLGLSVG